MGFFGKLFDKTSGEPAEKPEEESSSSNIAFVLLHTARLPDPADLTNAFQRMAPNGETLSYEGDEEAGILDLSNGDRALIALMDRPVPDGEAEHYEPYSLGTFCKRNSLQAHHAHILIVFHTDEDTPTNTRLLRFTAVLAAIVDSSPATGVYWGDAGATHSPDFFIDAAEIDDPTTLPIALWSGLSVAREEDGRISFLSTGMTLLGLPNLYLIAGKESEADAVDNAYNLLHYIAQRGEALPDGDTIGRSETEKIQVRYVPSPTIPEEEVWRVEFP